MLVDGLELMAIGMGIVFTFLTIMVISMYGSAAVFRRFAHLFPEPEEVPALPKPRAAGDEEERVRVAVAIAAAAHRMRGGDARGGV